MGMDYIDNRDFHWICNENIPDNSQDTTHNGLDKQSSWNCGSRCDDKHKHNKYSHEICHRDNNLILQTTC